MSVRIDKWLWSTRFYKTRALAKKHVESGKVKLAGQKVKPSRSLNNNDLLEIHKGELIWHIQVVKLIEKRVGAKIAVTCYQEDEKSIKARKNKMFEDKLIYTSTPKPAKHPDKKSRRELIKIKKGGF